MTSPQGMSIFDWLSIVAIALSLLSMGWHVRHYSRGLKVYFRRIEVTQVGDNRYMICFRFSLWNPSSQRRGLQTFGYDGDSRFLFFGQLTEPQRWAKKGDKDTLVLVDEKGNYLCESPRNELFESGLNIEPHQVQNISIPILLDVKTEDMTPLTGNKFWHIGFSALDPSMKQIARCNVDVTLHQLTTPGVSPI